MILLKGLLNGPTCRRICFSDVPGSIGWLARARAKLSGFLNPLA